MNLMNLQAYNGIIARNKSKGKNYFFSEKYLKNLDKNNINIKSFILNNIYTIKRMTRKDEYYSNTINTIEEYLENIS